MTSSRSLKKLLIYIFLFFRGNELKIKLIKINYDKIDSIRVHMSIEEKTGCFGIFKTWKF